MTSDSLNALGSRSAGRAPATSAVGSVAATSSSSRNRWSPRSTERLRATVDGLLAEVRIVATYSSMSRVVARLGVLPRAASASS